VNFETRQNIANEIWLTDARSALDKVHQQIKTNTLSALPNHQNQRHAHGAIQSYWHSCYKLMAPLQVQIEYVNTNESFPCIELKNTGPAIIDLENWRLELVDNGDNLFVFPRNSYIKPGQIIKVEQQQSTFMFNKPSPVFNQLGNQIKLFDAEGSLVSCWLSGKKAHDSVIISHICLDSMHGKDQYKDHIELINLSTSWVDISGWVLNVKEGERFVFPPMSKIEPCSELKIYANHIEYGCFSFESQTPIFCPSSSAVVLLDNRNQLVNEYHFA
jgi:hypothetical protein